jgi:pantetheine-phosphate adenylyltransferase
MKFNDINKALLKASFQKQLENEKKTFLKFQHVDHHKYSEARLAELKKNNSKGELSNLISYLKIHKPSIGVFAGSFDPFHKGHYNVLQKAERIFDKVIIAFGNNPDKSKHQWPIPKKIQNRQIESYSGLLTDFVDSLHYDVTVIRGLRNSTDFQYEQNQYRYIQELKKDIKIINIFCDKEFEHISSSGIRTLQKFGKHKNYLLD